MGPPQAKKCTGLPPMQLCCGTTQQTPATTPPHSLGWTMRAQEAPAGQALVVSHASEEKHAPGPADDWPAARRKQSFQ